MYRLYISLFFSDNKVVAFWQISRLIFTNSGNAILALASNAIHLLWKWQRNERNATGKVKLTLFLGQIMMSFTDLYISIFRDSFV